MFDEIVPQYAIQLMQDVSALYVPMSTMGYLGSRRDVTDTLFGVFPNIRVLHIAQVVPNEGADLHMFLRGGSL